eukprot:PITA_10142
MFPRVNSVRIHLDKRMDSRVMYNVQQYGAKTDGTTDNIKAFLAAWNAACSSTRPSSVYIPKGLKFLVSQVSFTGPCKNADIMVQISGNLIAPSNNNLWNPQIPNQHWLEFTKVDGLTVNGGGSLDGQGASWWNMCKKSLRLVGTTNTVVRDLTSIDSKRFHITIDSSDKVLVEGLTIRAPADSPNTDGIHIDSSNVHLRNLNIGTGDDCIGILEGSWNLYIEQVTCGPGHGISVGSLGGYPSLHGVNNVTVNGASFTGTDNGVRIKTLPGGKGIAKGIRFENIHMNNVANPIIIDQYYCPHCTAQESNMNVQISDVMYKNITGTSATKEVINLTCSKNFPCEGIKMENVKLNYGNNGAQSVCKNVKGLGANSVKPSPVC